MKRSNVRLLLALVLMLILLPTLPLRAVAETEPSDVFAQAWPIIVGWQNAIHGQHASPSHADYYHFDACAGCTYVIETFSVEKLVAAGSTGLYLYGTDGTSLLEENDGTPGHEHAGTGHADARIVRTFAALGTYYIKVTSQPGTSWVGTYSLRVLPKYDVSGHGWDDSNDHEPNDVWEISNSFSAGIGNAQTHEIYPLNSSSYVTHAPDRDWYRFTAAGGTQYYIETFDVVNEGNDGAGLQLYGADKDTPLKVGTRVTSSSGRVWERIIYSVPASGGGAYFVRVAPDTKPSWTGWYSLRACQGPCESSSGRVYVPLILKAPAPPPEVIFYDDFSDPNSGWPIDYESDVCDADYDDGKYRVEVKKYDERCVIPGYPVPPTPNGTFSTSVRRTSPKERGLMYGFFFGAGSDWKRDRWALEVRPDRVDCDDYWAPFFWLSYYIRHGETQEWYKCMESGINTGDRKWNELKVKRNGSDVKVYINGHKKMEKKKDVLLDDGFFYLEVISLYENTSWVEPVVVEFDWFKVERLSP